MLDARFSYSTEPPPVPVLGTQRSFPCTRTPGSEMFVL
jgi:hypothetical protein